VPGYISEYIFLPENNPEISVTNYENGILSIKLPMKFPYNYICVFDYGKKKKRSEYYRLCQKFDDLYYNQYVDELREFHNDVHAIADVITDIKIASDDAWNAAYTKDVLLNDIFSIKCTTIYPYIKSRYTADPVCTAIDKPVPEIVESDLTLLQYKLEKEWGDTPSGWVITENCFLEFYTACLPENPVQSLHITLTTDEGKKLEYPVEIDLRQQKLIIER